MSQSGERKLKSREVKNLPIVNVRVDTSPALTYSKTAGVSTAVGSLSLKPSWCQFLLDEARGGSRNISILIGQVC